MSDQEAFDNAVAFIQSAIRNSFVIGKDWGKEFKVSQLYIDGTRIRVAKWYNRDDDRDSGFYLEEHAKISLTTATENLKKELEETKKAHEEAVKKATAASAEFERSQARVRELEKKLIQSGG